ncbi:Carcinoembryonic antigen-related cell adhesion molecule 3 [Lemmus lemmus]
MILCKGYTPWQGLLLTASLLTYWLPPTTAQLTIQSVPPNVVEGKNVLLVARNIPENLRSFVWYRGATAVNRHEIAQTVITTNRSLLGPAHSGREAVYPNGSLLLHNVTQKDTGLYTLRTLNTLLETQETQVYLHIYSKSFFVTSGSGGVDFPLHTQDCPLWTDCVLFTFCLHIGV